MSLTFIFSFAACKSNKETQGKEGENNNEIITASFVDGTPKAVGDKFDMPEIEQSNSNLTVVNVTKQARPDDSILLAGEGFSASGVNAYVYSETTGKFEKAQYTISDDNIANVVIDKDYDYGMYAVYLEDSNGKSNVSFVNKPSIWKMGLTKVTAGDTVELYGENLSTDYGDKSNVFLVKDGKYCEAKVVYADPFKVEFQIPIGLEDKAEYEVVLHSGHGGEYGFATAPEKITYSSKDPNAYTGKVINVTDYGADPKDSDNDDTKAIQEAFNDAEDGDIVYFPQGVYFCTDTVEVPSKVRIIGDGKKNTYLIPSDGIKDCFIRVLVGAEVCNVGFMQKRKTGALQCYFIGMYDVYTDEGVHNLYVHDCYFEQYVPSTAKSTIAMICSRGSSCIIVEDNLFDGTEMFRTNTSEKVFIRNNEYYGACYSGTYYGANWMVVSNVNGIDISGNKAIGKDALTDDSGRLDTNDMHVGRGIVIQGYGKNIYIAKNHIERSGIVSTSAGELILVEGISSQYTGGITAATTNTITLTEGISHGIQANDTVNIVSGKGMGQYVSVKTVKKNLITLKNDLIVAPDTTSHIVVDRTYQNLVAYSNYFEGHSNYKEVPGGTTGIQVYGGSQNFYFVDNECKWLAQGICITPFFHSGVGGVYGTSENAECVVYWSQFDGNDITDCGVGVRYYMSASSDMKELFGVMTMGVTLRRNNFKDIPDYTNSWKEKEAGNAINVGVPPTYSMYEYSPCKFGNGNLIENCTFENTQYNDITFNPCMYNTFTRNNTSKSGDLKIKIDKDGFAPIEIE